VTEAEVEGPGASPLTNEARDAMITDNLGLAHQLARRFLHRGEPLEDLVQVASVALVKSVDRFDPDRGVDFAAFATRTIIGELKRHFRDKGWAVRASRRVQELYLELGHATSTLVQELGRSPTVAELARMTDASEEAVLEAIEAGQGYRATSIDVSENEDDPLSARMGATPISTPWKIAPSLPRPWPASPPASSPSSACVSSRASRSRRSPGPSGSARCTCRACWRPASRSCASTSAAIRRNDPAGPTRRADPAVAVTTIPFA
jgi:RNA polymerase sigma factor (sigma-70 family)